MEKMLAVVVDSEVKAYEASRALAQLDAEGSIWIYALAVIGKNADGTVSVKESDGEFPVRLAGGTAIGALIGLLGGPVGFAIGTIAGSLAGGITDLYIAGVDEEFVDDVTAKLTAGKFAVIADVTEEWITPVDTQMERIGGTVLRAVKKTVEADQRARKVARIRAEIDQLKAEQARAHSDRKAKLQARIDKANAQLEAQQEQIRKRLEQIRSEGEAKVRALQKKAQTARADTKAGIEAETKRIRQENDDADARMRHALAEELREAAARIDKEPVGSHR